MDSKNHNELPVSALRWTCPDNAFEYESTKEVPVVEGTIGQPKALRALEIGLGMNSPGFHVFVTGLSGTGRMTTVRNLLSRLSQERPTPNDICYVYNFRAPDNPSFLQLDPGKGRLLQRDMDVMIEALRKDIPRVFESEAYRRQTQRVIQMMESQQREIYQGFEKQANLSGFAVVQVETQAFPRTDLMPMVQGNAISFDQLEQMTEEGQFAKDDLEGVQKRYSDLSYELVGVMKETRKLERDAKAEIIWISRDLVRPLLAAHINEMKQRYGISDYLDQVEAHILDNLEKFPPREGEQPKGDLFREYRINALVDNSETRGAPIVIESHPTFRNLFGVIEQGVDRSAGEVQTDFTHIKGGSLLRANGGYLVLYAADALIEPNVWITLKRTLKTSKLEIRNTDLFFPFQLALLKPEPIPISVKVVLIGEANLYQLLYTYDLDFRKIFKISADFDWVMERSGENINKYVSVVAKISKEEDLLPFDRSAMAAIVEYGLRLAGKQDQISTQFTLVADLAREADFWARKDNHAKVDREYVQLALERKIERSNLIEEKVQEYISKGYILVEVDGRRVGQVNGLSLMDYGFYAFGRPNRITAQVSLGAEGIINIEREAQMSGKIHDKGVMIIAGFLRGRFAREKPLSIEASVCFEQSYSGIEGDSASAAEVIAIMSAIGEIPLRQDIAITGSVNQHGQIQPVGGVNEKIEGFFETCDSKGLTGNQGAIIPIQNVSDLMLKDAVVDAVASKKFHIYPVSHIDEAVALLTSMSADQVIKAVDQLLEKQAQRLREFKAD